MKTQPKCLSVWTRTGLACVILMLVTAATPTFAQSTFQFAIDPKATYLLTNNDPLAVAPVPVDLSAIGVQPGQQIRLSVEGSVALTQGGALLSPVLLGLFSSDGTAAGAVKLQGNPSQLHIYTLPT